jgi:hypothetical protein
VNQPTPLQKLIFIAISFSFLLLIGGLFKGFGFLLLLGSFIFFPALMALGIDHIRVNIAWHPIIKLIAYALIFLIGFIIMAVALNFMDSQGPLV